MMVHEAIDFLWTGEATPTVPLRSLPASSSRYIRLSAIEKSTPCKNRSWSVAFQFGPHWGGDELMCQEKKILLLKKGTRVMNCNLLILRKSNLRRNLMISSMMYRRLILADKLLQLTLPMLTQITNKGADQHYYTRETFSPLWACNCSEKHRKST